MSDLPEPLTPLDCDLRGLQFMPLYGDRLFTSETWLSARAEAKVAMQQLWWRSYAHEVPAASLPDNDALLASYAGYGVAVAQWRKIKGEAMRGWVQCSDGRLYHPFVAQLALEAWEGRKRNREKQRQWREKTRSRDGDVTERETVTRRGDKTVTRPLRNAGEGQGQGEGQHPPTPQGGEGGPAALSAKDWFARVEAVIAGLPGVNRTTTGLANVAPLRALCEPTNGEEPCDWAQDVEPAIQAVAASCAASGKPLRSWTHPAIADTARANRDRRLDGGPPASAPPKLTRTQRCVRYALEDHWAGAGDPPTQTEVESAIREQLTHPNDASRRLAEMAAKRAFPHLLTQPEQRP